MQHLRKDDLCCFSETPETDMNTWEGKCSLITLSVDHLLEMFILQLMKNNILVNAMTFRLF